MPYPGRVSRDCVLPLFYIYFADYSVLPKEYLLKFRIVTSFMLRTKIDDLLDILEKRKRADLGALSSELNWNPKALERVAQALDRAGVVRLNYPINIAAKPWLILYKKPVERRTEERKGKVLETYPVSGMQGHVQATVHIVYDEQENRPRYFSESPRIGAATWKYFDLIRDEITKRLPLEERVQEKTSLLENISARHAIITSILRDSLAPEETDLETMCGLLLRDMYGLGDVELLIADPWLEEIIINTSSQSVAVYHRKHGWLQTNLYLESEEEVENYAAQIARRIGKQISLLNPILDAHMLSGDRVNATLFPVSSRGHSITLRLFARSPWTITRFLQKPTSALTLEMAALLWQAIHYELNIMVSGGTASGKTSMLNSLVALIPPFQRIISVEDTRELSLPSYQWNWVPMVTRLPNPEGLGEITMLDLVVNALRMRPDRIVMGEIRRKREAEVLFEAMHTGHSVYATFHADTASQVVKRLTEPPIEVPKSQVEDIHLMAVQYRDRRKNLRRLFELVEVAPGPTGPELNPIYIWKARTDEFQLVRPPRRYVEQLNLHTGMTEKEITADQKNKVKILQWMVDNKLEDIDPVGAVMKAYYADEARVVQAVEKKRKPEKVLG